MKPEEFIERNIKTFIEQVDKTKTVSPSYLQRTCRIGYLQAIHTLEEMERRNLIARDKPWNWKWA